MGPEIEAFVSELLHDEEHSECGHCGLINCISCIVSSWSEDVGSPPTKSAEKELYIVEHETIFAIGDRKPERYGSTTGRRSGSRWKTTSFVRSRQFHAQGAAPIELCSRQEARRLNPKAKKSKAATDYGFPLGCKFISGAVKKILKSTAMTCDGGGERGQWVIHTKTGAWIVNVETKRKIPLSHVGNTYFMDAWVRVPDKGKDKSKDKMEVDSIHTKKPGFTWPGTSSSSSHRKSHYRVTNFLHRKHRNANVLYSTFRKEVQEP